MAHVPYYGEDLQHTQEKKKMVFNFNKQTSEEICTVRQKSVIIR